MYKRKKGITLIALIITVIVMIILVAVSVTVALEGGVFDKASDSAKQIQIEADREELLSAVVAAYDEVADEVIYGNIRLTEGWTPGSNGKYTSPKGNTFKVLADGTIILAGGEGGGTDDDDTPPGEQVPPTYQETITGLDEKVTVVAYNDLENLNNTTSENVYLRELGTNLKTAVDSRKVSAVLKETISEVENIAVIPVGFTVSTADKEDSISEGLVLKDGANEYVWMPYTDSATYVEDSFEPVKSDTQEILTNYYKYKNEGQTEPFFDINDFTYAQDKKNIEESINKYRGFIVGRYETTITAEGVIGSMPNETVLQSDKKITQTNNEACKWYGLYKVQKDLYAGNDAVFSSMITSKEWDRIMTFTGYSSAVRDKDTTYTSKPDKSGVAYKDSNPAVYDETHNIYDLAGNLREWTLKVDSSRYRTVRGGYCVGSYSAYNTSDNGVPGSAYTYYR